MFKKVILALIAVFVVLCLVSFLLEANLNKPSKILKSVSTKDSKIFDVGTELVYSVKYMNIIPAGYAIFKTKGVTRVDNNKVYILELKAETAGLVGVFYKAKAVIESLMDQDRLYTYKYAEDLYLPDEHKNKVIFYDQKRNIARRKEHKVKILPNTQDPLSCIFYLRTQEFEAGKKFNINILSKEENYLMRVNVLDKKDDISKLSIKVARQDGSSHHGGKFFVWISNDSSKAPLLIKASTKLGSVSLRLIDIKRNKN